MTDLFDNTDSLVGLHVQLNRAIDWRKPCHDNAVRIGAGRGPHAYALFCEACNKHRGWLSKAAAAFLTESIRVFGAVREPIIVRDAINRNDGATEMKRDAVFPSKYLKAADLNGKPIAVTIESAPFEALKNTKGEEEHKVVLHFVGAQKTLPLNQTNFDAVTDIVGDDETEEWPGHKIELYPTKTQMGGKTVDCIRIRPPMQREIVREPRKPAPTAPGAESLEDEMDDAIPF